MTLHPSSLHTWVMDSQPGLDRYAQLLTPPSMCSITCADLGSEGLDDAVASAICGTVLPAVRPPRSSSNHGTVRSPRIIALLAYRVRQIRFVRSEWIWLRRCAIALDGHISCCTGLLCFSRGTATFVACSTAKLVNREVKAHRPFPSYQR